MKLGIFATLALCLVLAIAGPSSAQIARFDGHWHNTNPNTKGLVGVDIKVNGTDVTVRGWGACTPTPCDWGAVDGYAYATDVGADPAQTADAVTAEFTKSFEVTLLTIQPRGDDLFITAYTRFTDGSGRTAYRETGTFRREMRHLKM